jgi:hypothetical protein
MVDFLDIKVMVYTVHTNNITTLKQLSICCNKLIWESINVVEHSVLMFM